MKSQMFQNLITGLLIIVMLMPSIGIASSLTIVNVFARQKAVKEGQQAVIQCQIWNIRKNDVVSLTKISNGVSKTLVYNGNLVADKRNFFLTKHAAKDGATYFVLKIKSTVKDDEGNYTFGVGRPASGHLRTVSVDSVMLRVHFLPGPGNPICVPSGRLILTQGDAPELSCASEEGNPQVMLYWKLKETDKKMKSTSHTRNRVQTSTIKIEVTAEDNGITFICALYSHPFRNQPTPNCSVGPIRVVNKTNLASTSDTKFDPKFKSGTGLENRLVVSVTIIAVIISTIIFAVLIVMIMTRRRRRMALNNHKRMCKRDDYDEVIEQVVNDPREKIIKDNHAADEFVEYSHTIPQPDGRNVNIAIHLNLTDTTCTAAISAENAVPNVPPEYAVASVNVSVDKHPDMAHNDSYSYSDTEALVSKDEIVEERCVSTNVGKLAHAHFVTGNNDIAYTLPNPANKQEPMEDSPSPKLSVFFSSIDI